MSVICRASAKPLPGRYPICHRGPGRPYPSALSRVSRWPSGRPAVRGGVAAIRAAVGTPGRRPEINFTIRGTSGGLRIVMTKPGGVPPAPQPLTHPANRPWFPFREPGSSFVGCRFRAGVLGACDVALDRVVVLDRKHLRVHHHLVRSHRSGLVTGRVDGREVVILRPGRGNDRPNQDAKRKRQHSPHLIAPLLVELTAAFASRRGHGALLRRDAKGSSA